MQTKITVSAVVAEAVTLAAAAVAVEYAGGIDGCWDEGERVSRVRWVGDELGHLGAWHV